MKLHPDTPSGQNTITACGTGFIAVNGRRHQHSLVVAPDRLDPQWPVSALDQLHAGDLADLAGGECDVLLLGTGARQHFPAPEVMRALFQARIGVEVMDTPAACRTYNILMAEGRRVVAALILD